MTRLAPIRRTIAAVIGVLVLLASAWIHLPPFNDLTHALSVGAAEGAPWLIAGGMLALLLAMPDVRRRPVAQLAAVCAVVGCILPARVMIAIDPAYREIDRTFQRAFGTRRPPRIPVSQLVRMREPAFSLRDAFGLGSPPIVREQRDIPFVRQDGVTLTLDIYRPEVDQHGPAVIQFYGGAWRSGVTSANAAFARELTRLGYVVFAPDYRHAPQWRWPSQLDDARAAVAWVIAHASEYGADAGHVFLVGRSSGAQLALLAGITDSTSRIRSIVAMYSPVDLTDGYRHPSQPDILGTRDLESALIGGTLDEKPEGYRSASPIEYASRPHPPVLLINGGRDVVIQRRVAGRLRDRLTESGVTVFLELPWAGHAFDTVPFGPGGQVALTAIERFLATTLEQ